jgi:hypothetical protein
MVPGHCEFFQPRQHGVSLSALEPRVLAWRISCIYELPHQVAPHHAQLQLCVGRGCFHSDAINIEEATFLLPGKFPVLSLYTWIVNNSDGGSRSRLRCDLYHRCLHQVSDHGHK